jgi:hypothetical protein
MSDRSKQGKLGCLKDKSTGNEGSMEAWTYLYFLSPPHTEESASVLWDLKKEAENKFNYPHHGEVPPPLRISG